MDSVRTEIEETMSTNRFGFFTSRPKSEAIGELECLRSDTPQENESLILKYLESGTQVVAVAGLASDLLSKGGDIVGPPHEFSDGVWSWTADVVHYVKRYHVRVPEAFVDHMKANSWVPSDVVDAKSVVSTNWVT
jgi:hypothetical protein